MKSRWERARFQGALCALLIALRGDAATLGDLCVTPCGLIAENQGSCAEIESLEAEEIILLGPVFGAPPERLCAALADWVVLLHPRTSTDEKACSGGWAAKGVGCIVGYTHTDIRGIEVVPGPYHRGALAHELVHALDWAMRRHMGHCLWDARLRAVLLRLTGAVDYSAPEPFCADGGAP